MQKRRIICSCGCVSEEGRIIQHPDKKTFKEHIRTTVMTFSEKPQKPQTKAQEQTQEKVKEKSGDDEITYVKLTTENPYFVVPSDAFDFLIKNADLLMALIPEKRFWIK